MMRHAAGRRLGQHLGVVGLCILLAGCAEPGGDPVDAPVADDATLTLEGLIVDDTVTPVAGASVILDNTHNMTTGADGAFRFVDVAAGAHVVSVQAEDHVPTQVEVHLDGGVDGAGSDEPLRITLARIERPAPYIEEIVHGFFLDGGVWIIGQGGASVGGYLGGDDSRARLNFAPQTMWVQGELTWEAAQPAAETMRLTTALYNGENMFMVGRDERGTSPIVAAWGGVHAVEEAVANDLEIFVQDGTSPIGLTASQELEYFLHVFHHFEPPEGWSFGAHGLPTVPPP